MTSINFKIHAKTQKHDSVKYQITCIRFWVGKFHRIDLTPIHNYELLLTESISVYKLLFWKHIKSDECHFNWSQKVKLSHVYYMLLPIIFFRAVTQMQTSLTWSTSVATATCNRTTFKPGRRGKIRSVFSHRQSVVKLSNPEMLSSCWTSVTAFVSQMK